MLKSLRRSTIIGLLLFVAILGGVLTARSASLKARGVGAYSLATAPKKSCDLTPAGHDTSLWQQPRFEGETREEANEPDCDPISTQTEVWFSGWSLGVNCYQGTSNGDQVCYNWSDTESQAEVGIVGACDQFLGVGRHYGIANNVWVRLGDTDHYVVIWPGSCPMRQPSGGPGDEDDSGTGGGGDFETVPFFPPNTPIILPLTQRAVAYKLTDKIGGVVFDLNTDGVLEQTAWTAEGSELAFLAMDRNGNGLIDSGQELFGDRTTKGVGNGFQAIRALNLEMGGTDYPIIDADQPIYSKLLLWEDKNHNGVSESTELQPFSKIYSDIGLGLKIHKRKDGHGNQFYYQSFAHLRTAAGKNFPASADEDRTRTVRIYDVIFNIN